MGLHVTRRTSHLLAGGVLLVFFIGSTLLVRRNVDSRSTPEKEIPLVNDTNEESLQEQDDTSTPILEKDSSIDPEMEASEPVVFQNFERSQTKEGKLIWRVSGKEAQIDRDKGFIVVQQGQLQLEKEELGLVTITSNKARISTTTNGVETAHGTGDVSIKSQDLGELTTEEAMLDNKAETLSSPVKTTIATERFSITGNSFVFEIPDRTLRMEGRIESVLRPAKSKTESVGE